MANIQVHRAKATSGSMYVPAAQTGGRSVDDSQNMLPRPHHDFEQQKMNQTEFKSMKQYN